MRTDALARSGLLSVVVAVSWLLVVPGRLPQGAQANRELATPTAGGRRDSGR